MERRTFLGTCAAMLGLPWCVKPVRPANSFTSDETTFRVAEPYIEMVRPEYEEPPAVIDGTLYPLCPEEVEVEACGLDGVCVTVGWMGHHDGSRSLHWRYIDLTESRK